MKRIILFLAIIFSLILAGFVVGYCFCPKNNILSLFAGLFANIVFGLWISFVFQNHNDNENRKKLSEQKKKIKSLNLKKILGLTGNFLAMMLLDEIFMNTQQHIFEASLDLKKNKIDENIYKKNLFFAVLILEKYKDKQDAFYIDKYNKYIFSSEKTITQFKEIKDATNQLLNDITDINCLFAEDIFEEIDINILEDIKIYCDYICKNAIKDNYKIEINLELLKSILELHRLNNYDHLSIVNRYMGMDELTRKKLESVKEFDINIKDECNAALEQRFDKKQIVNAINEI